MGPQKTSTQIEPFPFAAYNGRGSGCPTSPVWTIVGNNLGAFKVIQSENKCSNPKPALGRAIPFAKLPGVRTREGTILIIYLPIFASLTLEWVMLPKHRHARIRKTSPPHERYDARCFVFPKIFCQNQRGCFLFQNTCIVYIVY